MLKSPLVRACVCARYLRSNVTESLKLTLLFIVCMLEYQQCYNSESDCLKTHTEDCYSYIYSSDQQSRVPSSFAYVSIYFIFVIFIIFPIIV